MADTAASELYPPVSVKQVGAYLVQGELDQGSLLKTMAMGKMRVWAIEDFLTVRKHTLERIATALLTLARAGEGRRNR